MLQFKEFGNKTTLDYQSIIEVRHKIELNSQWWDCKGSKKVDRFILKKNLKNDTSGEICRINENFILRLLIGKYSIKGGWEKIQ